MKQLKTKNIKHWKLIISGALILSALLGIGYIASQEYSEIQERNRNQEERNQKVTQQLNDLLEETNKLKLNNELLKATLAVPQSTPTSIPIVEKTNGCDQSKLDAFKEYAIISGYDEKEVAAYIEVVKSSDCRRSKSSIGNEIESKLDDILDCQRYGICY